MALVDSLPVSTFSEVKMRVSLSFLPLAGVVAALGLLVAPQSAHAEEYPYSGLYWPAAESPDPPQLDALCALSFLDQHSDGTWAVYHVDLEDFRATRKIAYHRLSAGECKFTPETKVEACLVSMDLSFPEVAGDIVYDVVTALQDDRVETVMIQAASGWETVMQDGAAGNAGALLNYLRCPIDENALRSRISGQDSTASADVMNALRFPSEEVLASPEVADLLQALRGP